jgi:hypothetical protein
LTIPYSVAVVCTA